MYWLFIISEKVPEFFAANNKYYISAFSTFESLPFEASKTEFKTTMKQFFSCSIELTDCNFTDTTSFDRGIYPTGGGALSAANSKVTIKNSDQSISTGFVNNVAGLGGAILLSGCDSFIQYVKFAGNTAHMNGGAIYATTYLNKECELFIFNSHFTNNSANDVGGAISLVLLQDAYIDGCKFINNEAKLRGGAIFVQKTKISIFASRFELNTVGKITDESIGSARFVNSDKSKKYLPDESYHFRGRGGAAIYYMGDQSNESLPTIYTEGTCFLNNQAHRGADLGDRAQRPGHHIMLDLNCKWDSYHDTFIGPSFDPNIAHVTREFKNSTVIVNYLPHNNTDCTGDPVDQHSPIPIKFANISNTGDDKIVANIANPTKYTYRATPLTKVPSETTQSHLRTKRFSKAPTRESHTIPSPTQSAVIPPSNIVVQTIKPGFQGNSQISSSISYTSTIIYKETMTETLTATKDANGNETFYWTFETTNYSEVTTIAYNLVFQIKKGLDTRILISIIVVCCLIVLIIIAVAVIIIIKSRNKEDPESAESAEDPYNEKQTILDLGPKNNEIEADDSDEDSVFGNDKEEVGNDV